MKSTIMHTRTKNQMDKVCVYVIIHYVLEKERPCFLIPFCLISDVRQRGEDTCSGFAQIRGQQNVKKKNKAEISSRCK